MRQYTIHHTVHLHPMMLMHCGQRLKLTEKLYAEDRLVQEATGTVLHVVLDPSEPLHEPDENGNIVQGKSNDNPNEAAKNQDGTNKSAMQRLSEYGTAAKNYDYKAAAESAKNYDYKAAAENAK